VSLASILPGVNATLNALSAALVVAGYLCIRRGKAAAHKRCMLSALVVSSLFLVGYLTLRAVAGMTRFTGEGWIRPVYFAILSSHTVLAALIVPLVSVTAVRALRGDFQRHVRIARWTLPLWWYVSVTGVLIYWLLYHLYPSA
jgi:putative membrane protein